MQRTTPRRLGLLRACALRRASEVAAPVRSLAEDNETPFVNSFALFVKLIAGKSADLLPLVVSHLTLRVDAAVPAAIAVCAADTVASTPTTLLAGAATVPATVPLGRDLPRWHRLSPAAR